MGSLKRKDAPGGTSAIKPTQPSAEGRPSKRAKATKKNIGIEDAAPLVTPKSKPSSVAISSHLPASKLRDEEPLFPRGGGSVLSPLEHKQIQIQAKNDVLFEQGTQHSAAEGGRFAKKKKRTAGPKGDRPERDVTGSGDSVKIESLNYKRLVKGSLVLGQICEIDPLGLSVALPNNLTGHVPITSISSALSDRVKSEAEKADDEGDLSSEAADGYLDLKSMFHVGQFLRVFVSSTMEDPSVALGKGKRRIELAIQPEHANSGLSDEDVVTNCTVMASVTSVEDHGFVMDLSIANSELRGFLPRKELDAGFAEQCTHPGAVVLCLVTGRTSNGKVAQLSLQPKKLGSVKHHVSEAATISAFLPGTAVDVLVSEISSHGIIGKVIGHLDVTTDIVHSGAGAGGRDLEERYKVGSRLKARIICTFPTAERPKLGVSVLPHILSLKPQKVQDRESEKLPLELLPISSTVERCVVRRAEPDIGLWVDVGVEGVPGFVHISRVKDGKVDALYESSGPYKVGTTHPGRIIGYNAADGIFLVSLERRVLEQPYLRIEDVPIGAVVEGIIEKLIVKEQGITGLIVQLCEGISGLVPEMHLSDIHLQHPEKKFREGMKVKARVLSADPSKHQLRLTLKKTLVNSEMPPLRSFADVAVGSQCVGTIVNILQTGAVVQFYGTLRGFLPVSEMSEAYIRDPKEHFRVGQVVSVRVLDFDADANKLAVSCKDPSAFGLEKQLAFKGLQLGDVVKAKITEKSEQEVYLEIVDSSLRAVLPVGHLTDKSPAKNLSALKRLHVGQILSDLVVMEKNERRRTITLSRKPSLVSVGQEGKLLKNPGDATVGSCVPGFVRNITATAVFVQFAANLTALLPKSLMPPSRQGEADFGLHKFDSLVVKIVSADNGRLVVTFPPSTESADADSSYPSRPKSAANPPDGAVASLDDIQVGTITKARVCGIKETQLNVELDGNIQGRIDVSEIYDSWEDIPDPKHPLRKFYEKQVLRVRVLGLHDARHHTFLPITKRSTHSVLELSAKPSVLLDDAPVEPLSLDKVQVGSSWLGFVNNHGPNCLWVSLSPAVRGRVYAMEASDDLSQVKDLAAHFPIGSAMRVRALAVNLEQRRLDLSARTPGAAEELTWDSVKQNMVLPGKVTKVSDVQVVIQLSKSVYGVAQLVDLSDDYDHASTSTYFKNDIVRVSVVSLDRNNMKLRLSTRPSRVLNSSLPVQDREVVQASDLEEGDIIRGFVKNVSDKGLFVSLGGGVTGFVRISDLSDAFLKDWKSSFQVGQLVRGRVVSVNTAVGQVQLSLKASALDKERPRLLTLADFASGQTVTGKIRKVEEFGAFIVIDNSANVSGLCHRSEMAESAVKDARKLFKEGDVVKAKILSIDVSKKRINFGLKPSYFEEDSDGDMDVDNDDAGATLMADEDEGTEENSRDASARILITGTDNDQEMSSDGEDEQTTSGADLGGLGAGGFSWSAEVLDQGGDDDSDSPSSEKAEEAQKKTRKGKKVEAPMDRTGELDVHGPQAASDYERLLLGQPDSSSLWIAYIAFQMQVSELAKAREIAERAVKTISIREETEKLNVWIAYLNLEVAYGTEETVEGVFKRACQYNDEQEVYERAASIYIQSGKNERADEMFQAMLRKFGARSPQVWTNYAHFLHHSLGAPDRARSLLPRAMQMLEKHAHLALMTRFAALEFRSPSGSPERGRTIFEGLLDTWPKKFDLWNQLLDLEISVFASQKANGNADLTVVRDVFERGTKVKGLKAKRAKAWFQRWAKWEEENGDAKGRERVSVKAKEWAAEAEAKKAEKEDVGQE